MTIINYGLFLFRDSKHHLWTFTYYHIKDIYNYSFISSDGYIISGTCNFISIVKLIINKKMYNILINYTLIKKKLHINRHIYTCKLRDFYNLNKVNYLNSGTLCWLKKHNKFEIY